MYQLNTKYRTGISKSGLTTMNFQLRIVIASETL